MSIFWFWTVMSVVISAVAVFAFGAGFRLGEYGNGPPPMDGEL